MINRTRTAALIGAAAMWLGFAAGPAHAGIVFSDDFEGVTAGSTLLNWDGGANWNVSSGTVDLVRSGEFGINCSGATGYCVDMDGSSGDAGDIVSLNLGPLGAGKYVLSYDLSGNQRGSASADSVTAYVQIGVADWTESLASNAGWQTFTREFTLAGITDPLSLRFEATGGDNIGMLLDNVVLTAVPEPATLGLLGAGLLGLGLNRRRRR